MSSSKSTLSPGIDNELSNTIGIDNIPDAVLIADAETRRIVYTNAAANELFRCQPGELNGCLQTELHPTGKAKSYAEAFERGLKNQRVNRLQSGEPLFIKTVDGDSIPVEITVQVITTEENEYLMGIFREASDQLARERALKQTTGRLEALLEALPIPVCVLDTEGTVKRWNRAAEETLGYMTEQIVGQQYSLLTETGELDSLLERVCDNETLHDYRTELRAKDGSRIPVKIDARPIYHDGSVMGVVGTAVDLSNQHQREQQLDILHRVARHNLRNELSVIRGWGELLKEGTAESGRGATKIMDASDRLLELSDDIVSIRHDVSEDQYSAPRDISNLATELSNQLQADNNVADIELVTKSATGQVQAKAVEATSELFSNMFHCSGSAAIRLEFDSAGSHTEVSATSDTPLFCSGDRVLIQQGTETALEHASGLKIARAYLTIRSLGGAVALEAGQADTPATNLRVELPRTDS